MRVAILSQEYPPETGWGGIGSFSYGLAQALASAGVAVDVIATSDTPDPSPRSQGSIVVHRAKLGGLGPLSRPIGRRLPLTALRLRAALGARSAVHGLPFRPDVVEAPDWMAEGLALAPGRRAPLVVHLHGSLGVLNAQRGLPATLDQRLAAGLEWAAAHRAAAVTAPSRRATSLPSGRSWLPPERVRLSTMPLPEDVLRSGEPVVASEPLIAIVGRLDRLKAPETLLAALAILSVEVPDVRAVFVGQSHTSESPSGGDYGEWLRREAALAGVSVEVRDRTDREGVLALYRRARVVAVPSRFESLSMVAIEALACGTPVVVTSATGVAEWLAPVDPSAIVPPDEPEALARALKRVLTDDTAAAHSATVGQRLVRERCSAQAVATERLALYGSLLGSSPAI